MTDGKKNDLFTLFFKMIIVGALALISQGCASVGENAALMNARAAYEKAKADPVVTANAQVPLYEAGQALNKAEKAENEPEMTHLAYLAEKRTAIAVATAQEKVLLDKRENLAAEKDRLLLEQKKRQLTTARGEVKELEQELAELKAKRTDRGYVVTLGDVLFATNKADLMPGAQRTIDQVATFLKKHPEMRVIVEGHTDSTGSAEYNLTLSKARAESVRSAIMMRGINPQQISAEGRGEFFPVASNANVAGRQQNRRVEILFVSDKQLPVR